MEYRFGQLQSLKTTMLNQLRRLTGQPVEGRAQIKSLDDVSFSAEQGEVVGIIGPNGAGESTMLKLLANARNRHQALTSLRCRRELRLARTKYSEFMDSAEYKGD